MIIDELRLTELNEARRKSFPRLAILGGMQWALSGGVLSFFLLDYAERWTRTLTGGAVGMAIGTLLAWINSRPRRSLPKPHGRLTRLSLVLFINLFWVLVLRALKLPFGWVGSITAVLFSDLMLLLATRTVGQPWAPHFDPPVRKRLSIILGLGLASIVTVIVYSLLQTPR